MRMEFVARRRIIGGFLIGNSYEFAKTHEQDTLNMRVRSFGNTATDGTQETDLEHLAEEYQVTTDHLTKDVEVPILLMALASQAGGEPFVLDLESDIAGQVISPLTVKLLPNQSFRPVKSIPLYRKISFRVRVV